MSEITEQGYTSPELPKQSRLGGGLTIVRMLLRNPAALKRFMVLSPDEPRYVRPPREYEIPPFRESMRYCTSNEKYLRPTRWCNPREPEVIAMANELGAYELSDYEFADAAYWFVKTKLTAEMLRLDSVSQTLKRGTGTCYHLTSVFIALCRAAGIKARYSSFMMQLPETITSRQMPEQSVMVVDFFSRPSPEAEGEACIDGKWKVAHVAMRPEMIALGYLPIPNFGEDAAGLVFKLIPGTTKHFESIPLGLGIQMNAGMPLASAVMERINVVIQTRALPIGRKIIEEAGGIEAYERKAREKFKRSALTIKAEPDEAVVFEE